MPKCLKRNRLDSILWRPKGTGSVAQILHSVNGVSRAETSSRRRKCHLPRLLPKRGIERASLGGACFGQGDPLARSVISRKKALNSIEVRQNTIERCFYRMQAEKMWSHAKSGDHKARGRDEEAIRGLRSRHIPTPDQGFSFTGRIGARQRLGPQLRKRA